MQWGNLNLDLIRRASRAAGVWEIFETILETARREVESASDMGKME